MVLSADGTPEHVQRNINDAIVDYPEIDPSGYSLVNLEPHLPVGWARSIMEITTYAEPVSVKPSSTSRHDSDQAFRMRTVAGTIVAEKLPWLLEFYHGLFADIVGIGINEIVCATNNNEYSVILNIIGPNDDPYEPHVDSNGATLVLPVSSHPSGHGGELVMSRDRNARGLFSLQDPDSIAINPIQGRGIIFDGTDKPHYVNVPTRGDRITAVFNYYTKYASELNRPPELSQAIGLVE